MTVEVYRTDGPRDAFGLFSLQRDGREDVSPAIASPHWLTPSQAGLAKGPFHVSLTGFGTAPADLEAMLKAIEPRLPGPAVAASDPRFARLPAEGRVEASLRFIKGEGAARSEAQILADPAWGFAAGSTAVSARYEPGDLKLIAAALASPDQAGLEAAVRAQFEANLEKVAARPEGLAARDGLGRTFLFAGRDGRAFLVWGRDEAAAAALLGRALR
jgi:hypothetical protein